MSKPRGQGSEHSGSCLYLFPAISEAVAGGLNDWGLLWQAGKTLYQNKKVERAEDIAQWQSSPVQFLVQKNKIPKFEPEVAKASRDDYILGLDSEIHI